MFNKHIRKLYHTESDRILSTFTNVTFSYVNSGYISLGLITLQYFFVPAFDFAAYKMLPFDMKTIGGEKSVVNNYQNHLLCCGICAVFR